MDGIVSWVVYILECKDKTLYTGITNNLEKRISQHEQGMGAKYTKGRAPFILKYTELCVNRSAASKREVKIKSLSRKEKLSIITKA